MSNVRLTFMCHNNIEHIKYLFYKSLYETESGDLIQTFSQNNGRKDVFD